MKKFLSLMLLASLTIVSQKMSAQTGNENYVTITTESGNYDGQWVFCVAPYEQPFVEGCWIDWNNNGTKEEGEDITEDEWLGFVVHELDSKTISIYGDITYMNFYGLSLTDIDFSHSNTLEYLDVSGNLLESIDLSKTTSIKDVILGDNPFSSIDFVNAPQLRTINLSWNPNLTEVDISTQKALEEFVFTDNENISHFDFTPNPNLKILYLEALPIETIDLTPNTKLTQIQVAFSDLKEIKLPDAPGMESVALYNNNMSGTLDVSGYPNLKDVFLHNNNFSELIIPKNAKDLAVICCFMNDLQTDKFMPVINDVFDRTTDPELTRGCVFMVDSEPTDENVVDKNSLTESAVDILMEKGWDAIDYAGANMYPYFGIDDVTGIKEARYSKREIIVSEVAGQVVVKVPVTMIGKTLAVFDAAGALVYTTKLTSSFTRIPALNNKKGAYIFKVNRQTVKAEI